MVSDFSMAVLVQPIVLNTDDQVGLAFAEDFFPDTGDAAQVKCEEKSVGGLE